MADDAAKCEEDARYYRETAKRLEQEDYRKNAKRIHELEQMAEREEKIALNIRAHQAGIRPPGNPTSVAAQAARINKEMGG
ncbi:hypothetical protein ACFY2J_16515 [Streptomyces collinus]|uniref:hypothetical protein n=1 Tax=Streptomyces collinus TaxID=42684 RepID=UPI0036A7B31E